MVIFTRQRKKIASEVKIKLSRKRLYPTDSVKYLGIRIDKNLNWKHHVRDIAIKLNRANALLFTIRNYANVIWARVSILQKKALRIISFQPRDCYSSPLFKK